MKLCCWLAAVLAAALACGPSSGPSPVTTSGDGGPKYGGNLNVYVTPDPFNWDITFSKSNPNQDGVSLANSSILGFKRSPDLDFNELVLRPELAERWEVSPDSTSFTFHLRPGAKFQNVPPVNGREVTSADLKFSAEYRLRTGEFKERKLPQAESDYMLEGLDRVETPDRYRAVFHFKEPFVPFINYAASDFMPVFPREVYDRDGHFQDTLIGAGAYILDAAASQKGTRWIFNKNPDYWDADQPYLDGIRWLVISQEATAYAAFQTRQIDMLYDPLDYNGAMEVMKANPQAENYKFLQPNSGKLYLSQAPGRNSPVQDIRIRRAIALAIDRDEINRALFGGQGEWGLASAIHGLFTEAEIKQIYTYDPGQARRLVVEAGYPNGVTLELPVPSDEEQTHVSTLQLLQAQWRKVGLNVELTMLDLADQRAKRRQGNFDIDHGPAGFSSLHDDPDSIVFGRFHSSSRNNYSFTKDPERDKLLEASRREPDPEKRRAILRSIARMIADQVIQLDLLYQPKWAFWHPHVKNYKPNFGSKADYSTVWLDR